MATSIGLSPPLSSSPCLVLPSWLVRSVSSYSIDPKLSMFLFRHLKTPRLEALASTYGASSQSLPTPWPFCASKSIPDVKWTMRSISMCVFFCRLLIALWAAHRLLGRLSGVARWYPRVAKTWFVWGTWSPTTDSFSQASCSSCRHLFLALMAFLSCVLLLVYV